MFKLGLVTFLAVFSGSVLAGYIPEMKCTADKDPWLASIETREFLTAESAKQAGERYADRMLLNGGPECKVSRIFDTSTRGYIDLTKPIPSPNLKQTNSLNSRVSKISECGAVTLTMGVMASQRGDTRQEAEMKRYAIVWGNTAMAIASKEGYPNELVVAENKRQLKNISGDIPGFISKAKQKMDQCTAFLKGDPEVLQAFKAAAN